MGLTSDAKPAGTLSATRTGLSGCPDLLVCRAAVV